MTEAHRIKRIVDSEVFKALNLLIDEAGDEIEVLLIGFKQRMDNAFSQPERHRTVSRRTSHEMPAVRGEERWRTQERVVPAYISDLGCEITALQEVVALRERIRKLNVMKLRLLNEYDFTHGDDATQKAVFG